MGLPQTMFFGGYELTQEKNFHVMVRTLEGNKRIGHFQCEHELSAEEMIELAHFVDQMRNGRSN